jgi:hypothetical protein
MHPDIAYKLGESRRAELLAAAAQQRLVDEAMRARTSRTDRGGTARLRWRVLRVGGISPT